MWLLRLHLGTNGYFDHGNIDRGNSDLWFRRIVDGSGLMDLPQKTETGEYSCWSKIQKAKEEGVHEPVSLHPVIDLNTCIKSGACLEACPEEDVLGIRNGRATLVNASHCVGHGACFHACPVEAISLRIGTEKEE